MKRCPECEFLYEDEQECCDMDGTVLRFTSFLPPLAPSQSIAKNDVRSIWSALAIPLLALVVIGSVLVTLYRATPSKFSSSPVPKNQPAGTSHDTKVPVSDSPQVVTAPTNRAEATDPFALPATRTQNTLANSTRPVPSTNEERPTIQPVNRDPFAPPPLVVNAPKAGPSQTSPVAPVTPKVTAGSNPISVHPESSPAKSSPQSKTQNPDKDSKFKSLFKKAKRVLKNPF